MSKGKPILIMDTDETDSEARKAPGRRGKDKQICTSQFLDVQNPSQFKTWVCESKPKMLREMASERILATRKCCFFLKKKG